MAAGHGLPFADEGRLVKIKHATIIQVPSVHIGTGTTQITIPPIGPAYVAAAMLQAGCTVDLIDGVGEWIDQYRDVDFAGGSYYVHGGTIEQIVGRVSPRTELIGVSCMFSHGWPMSRLLIKGIRERFPDHLIVLGGEHCSALPERCLAETGADIVVCGEGEDTVVDLVDALRAGRDLESVSGLVFRREGGFESTVSRPRIRGLAEIPRPAWHLVPVRSYIQLGKYHGPTQGTPMPILGTRGCPYQCTFCSSPNMWTTRWVAREPVDVADEMQLYREEYGANDFHFEDLTMVVRRDWILQFCDEIERRGWTDITLQFPSGTRSEAVDLEVARRLRSVGCSILTYAPESGSPAVLKRIKKKVSIPRMIESIRSARRAGMKVECFMIIGFPDETLGEMWKTFGFITRLAWIGVEAVGVGTYMPIPGTEIAEKLRQEGRLDYDDSVFLSMLLSNDIWRSKSWNPEFSDRTLAWLRFLSHVWFFGLAFAIRPWRLVRTLWNLVTGTQQTKFDKVVREVFLDRWLLAKSDEAS